MSIQYKHIVAALMAITIAAFAQPVKIEVGPAPPGPKPRVGVQKSSAQLEEQMMADRARRAELSGDYARALQLWKEVLNRSAWHPEAIEATPRILIIEKRFADADSFLVSLIRKSPFRTDGPIRPGDPTSTFSLALDRGTVAHANGESVRAKEIWDGALKEQGRTVETVTAYVREMQKNRMWEESEKTIRDFRVEGKQPGFMAIELASSLRAQMNFGAAAAELLLYADSQPGAWQAALSQLQQFPDDTTVHAKVAKTLKEATQKNKKNAAYWRIYSGYLLKSGDLAESLSATIVADSLTENHGILVLGAAQTMLEEGDVNLARKGFQKVLAWNPQPDVAARAELGLGRCLEALEQWAEAKSAYERFVESHPGYKEVDEARFRIAEILLQHQNQPAEALVMFKGLVGRAQGPQRALIGMREGDCHAWMGEYGPAIAAWGDVVRLNGLNQTEDGTQALYRIARANFWRDSTSLVYLALDSITRGNVSTTAFNDAIKFTALMEEGGVYRAQRAFAEADYASFRRDDSLAAARFDETASLLKTGKLAEHCRFMSALALRGAGAFTAAVAMLDTFVASYSGSADLDRAKYYRALIKMEDLKDFAGAKQEFEQFLVDHPRSIYLEQARRKARILASKTTS